ncbi:ABC transporter substrate-binding protein [Thermogymnomonas acidicola]|uniref:ABC transporter substrate-binding protein n=1 Tax=Thermogymnomonas acidicola TaxID=399579 RepID=UPI0009467D37|nr:ABC transporter substrate-binding protein [Thermogymnomonas acidicola]
MHYTFYLRHNVTFSNGYPYNAYVQWYSMYRTIIMNQAPSFILSQNFNYSNGVNFTVTPQELNTFNFTDPNASELQVMEYPYQSFQVINKYEIRLNLGYGYNGDVPFNSLLATLTTPMAAAVDPAYVDAHGGVQYGTINSYMTTHALGTGPYVLEKYVPGQTAVLEANPHYWAYNISSSQWNYAIHPPYVKEIVIDYQPVSTSISAAKAGQLQVIDDPSTQYYSTLKSLPGFNVTVLPVQFGSSEGGAYWVYMDRTATSRSTTSMSGQRSFME